MPQPPEDYPRIVRRILIIMAALALLGTVLWSAFLGLRGAKSFLGGSAVSGLSFWLLHRLVADLTAPAEGRRVSAPSILLHALRFVILGGAVYAIVRIYGLDQAALASGLLVAVAAITLEAIYELIYARK